MPASPRDTSTCRTRQCADEPEDGSDAGSEADEPSEGGDTPQGVADADLCRHTHQLLGPCGSQPVPDPRHLGWLRPRDMRPEASICLEGVSNKKITGTYAAQGYKVPRVFDGPDARYSSLLSGAGDPQRLMAAMAEGICCPAIPQEERHHLFITMHHGHAEGSVKCSGEAALCPRCLLHGLRVAETAIPKYPACPAPPTEVCPPPPPAARAAAAAAPAAAAAIPAATLDTAPALASASLARCGGCGLRSGRCDGAARRRQPGLCARRVPRPRGRHRARGLRERPDLQRARATRRRAHAGYAGRDPRGRHRRC